MKKTIMIIIALALLLSSLPLQPARAETTLYDFTVKNYLNDTIVIVLTSREDDEEAEKDIYEIQVSRFDSVTKELPKGEYDYEYTACKAIHTGILKLKQDVKWEILPCGVEPTKMRFNSHLSDKITVNMYGPLEMPEPEDQEFTVELGGNRIEDILSGTYIMTYEVACSTVAADPKTVFTEEFRVRKAGTTQITLRSCEWYAHPARIFAKPVPVKFQVVNHASFPLVLQIIGPQSELLTINPGVNTFQLIYGNYKYGYFLDHTYHNGYMMVLKNGLGQLVLKPSHIFELPGAGEDNGG